MQVPGLESMGWSPLNRRVLSLQGAEKCLFPLHFALIPDCAVRGEGAPQCPA